MIDVQLNFTMSDLSLLSIFTKSMSFNSSLTDPTSGFAYPIGARFRRLACKQVLKSCNPSKIFGSSFGPIVFFVRKELMMLTEEDDATVSCHQGTISETNGISPQLLPPSMALTPHTHPAYVADVNAPNLTCIPTIYTTPHET